MTRHFSCFLALCLVPALISTAARAASKTAFVPATEAHFLFEGRFDLSARGPVVIWQGSRIRFAFEGDRLALQFTDVRGQNYFDLEIDGRTTLVELREGAPPHGVELTGLGRGVHQAVLFKRSEAAAGTLRFVGLELAASAKPAPPTLPAYRTRMLFIGDSITAGACNEDGAADQWDDRRTHNNARSYGAFTAAAFDADYRNVAVSGMGISIGWVTPTAAEIWDRVYPEPTSARADLTTWTPDVVFVNLGENDDSFTKAKSLAFPSDYASRYVALVGAIRRAYPKAEIVILRGGMYGGAKSERLREPWEAAVAQLERDDPHVRHFVFEHWAPLHPRVGDHRKMAGELIAWLREQDFIPPRAK